MLKILMIMMISISAIAHTDPSVDVILNFDQSYLSKRDVHLLDYNYLTFVPEELSYGVLSSRQEEKFEQALEIVEQVVNSEEFKQKVISYVRPSNGKNEFQKNFLWRDSDKRLTNRDVLNVIMRGNEYMRSGTTGEMNFNAYVKKCNWFKQKVSIWCRKVIGSTTPSTSKWIKLNWKFYSYFETHQMVSNMVHEWLHLLGFLHGSEHIGEEVPYVVGQIAGDVAKKMLR